MALLADSVGHDRRIGKKIRYDDILTVNPSVDAMNLPQSGTYLAALTGEEVGRGLARCHDAPYLDLVGAAEGHDVRVLKPS